MPGPRGCGLVGGEPPYVAQMAGILPLGTPVRVNA